MGRNRTPGESFKNFRIRRIHEGRIRRKQREREKKEVIQMAYEGCKVITMKANYGNRHYEEWISFHKIYVTCIAALLLTHGTRDAAEICLLGIRQALNQGPSDAETMMKLEIKIEATSNIFSKLKVKRKGAAVNVTAESISMENTVRLWEQLMYKDTTEYIYALFRNNKWLGEIPTDIPYVRIFDNRGNIIGIDKRATKTSNVTRNLVNHTIWCSIANSNRLGTLILTEVCSRDAYVNLSIVMLKALNACTCLSLVQTTGLPNDITNLFPILRYNTGPRRLDYNEEKLDLKNVLPVIFKQQRDNVRFWIRLYVSIIRLRESGVDVKNKSLDVQIGHKFPTFAKWKWLHASRSLEWLSRNRPESRDFYFEAFRQILSRRFNRHNNETA